jgi:Fur family ferric uptake transcriptional regulator
MVIIMENRPRIGTRATRQRQVILEELQAVTSHPTADEVYHLVRQRLPKVSLGTVYRNLDLLSTHGVIQRLEGGGSQMRFDGNAAAHSHVRCLHCGSVADIHYSPPLPPVEQAQEWTEYELVGQTLNFTGICSTCNKAEQ